MLCMERHQGGPDLFRVHQEGLVAVGADAVLAADLAEVHRAVLVADDRVADLPALAR